MPGYRGHIVGGAATFCVVVLIISKTYQPTLITALQWFLLTIVGSLFPDVDIKSKGQGIFYRVILICLVLLYFQQNWELFAATSFVAMLPLLVRHRGLFHTIWFVVAVPFVLASFVAQSFPQHTTLLMLDAVFFASGAISHIVLDRMN